MQNTRSTCSDPASSTPEELNSLNPSIWPSGAERNSEGRLTIAGADAIDLLDRFGSPLYIIDEQDFRSRARRFAEVFAGWNVHYASKAFLCKAVARWVDEEGLGLDVCSGNELAVGLAAGFPPERIALHGNNKSMNALALAIDSGVGHIIVDCFEEIDRIESLAALRGVRVNVMVRVTTGVEAHTHSYIATSHEDQKFGFSLHSGQAMAALRECLARPHLRLSGIHSHLGSQIIDAAGFEIAADRMVSLIAEFRDRTGIQLNELNLGGGFGIAYTDADQAVSLPNLHTRITAIVDDACRRLAMPALNLAIEPGRAISGPSGVALYTVGVVKPVQIADGRIRTYVAVDGGMSDNIRPALYQADYTARLANRRSSAPGMTSRVVGHHCESGDILVRDAALPTDLHPGDVLAVPASGAYHRSMASNYNYSLRPPVVAVTDGQARLLLRRETMDDLLALDIG